MRVNYYQDFHEEKRSGESNNEIRVNVDDGAEVGAFVHVANVTNFDLVKRQNIFFHIPQTDLLD